MTHGFNSAHGRLAPIATGANAANRELTYIGISGDGDSLSIGMGHLCHAIRRNVKMLYVIENNGVYGLTKGQFSASAEVGSKSKKGEANRMSPIDPVQLGLSLGATFIARSFSGDKEQLVPILQAGLAHRGFAESDDLLAEMRQEAHEIVSGLLEDDIREIKLLQEHLHDGIGQLIYDRTRRRPMILPVVVEV